MSLKSQMLAHLRTIYTPGLVDNDSFNLSAEIAIYWFASDYHGGQDTELYSILSTSPYSPSYLCEGIDDDDDALAVDMYEDLVCVFNV